jgi:starch synthase
VIICEAGRGLNLKILFVTADYPSRYYIGGQGVVVRETALRLLARGHKVRVLGADKVYSNRWEVLPRREIDSGIEIFRHETNTSRVKISQFNLLPPMLRIRSVPFSIRHFLWADIIHFHNFWFTGFLMPLLYVALIMRKKFVYTPHYEDYKSIDPAMSYSYETIIKLFCKHATKVTAISKREARILSRYTKEIDIITWGVDIQRFREIAPLIRRKNRHTPVVLSIGTMCMRKNFVTLIRAMAEVPLPWKLIIVCSRIADLDYYEAVKRIIKQSGLKNYVEIKIGISIGELLNLYQQADLFVMPSLWEAFGLAAAEAMACGVPTILTSTCLIAEHFKNGESIIIVDVNDEEAMASKISELLKDRKKAVSIGKAGQEAIGKYFSWERVAIDFEKVYRNACHL